MDRDIEDRITIEQGVYGLLVSGCDSASCKDRPAAAQLVTVFSPDLRGDISTMSDGDGVYQIDLAAGDYTLCTVSCTSITVPASARVRYDWTSGPGGGSWIDAP